MNIFHQYAIKSIRKNKTRTTVTVIGIILACSMFTAVFQAANSGISYMRRNVIANDGAFEGVARSFNDEETENFLKDKRIKNSAVCKEVGWAEIGSQNEYKPYLLIKSIGSGFSELASLKLLSGRMPENANEIIIPEHLLSNGSVSIPNGSRIKLKVGERFLNDEKLGEHNPFLKNEEALKNTKEAGYTVVGTFKRLGNRLEDYACPGYTALTAGSLSGEKDILFTLKDPSRFYDFTSELMDSKSGKNIDANSELLAFYGSFYKSKMTTAVYSMAGILIGLIFFGSMSLIYNSFSISVSERTKEIGLLKTIGATKKQIRSAVLHEAAILGAVGIPLGLFFGCSGIGITLYLLRDSFGMLTGNADNVSDVSMRLEISFLGIAAAVVICFACILISAYIPASRVSQIDPIAAVRQTHDIKIKPKEVKTSFLTKKLFGFEGVMASKNFKRNKKRYRAAVLSIFVSVTLFVGASSFSKGLMKSTDSLEASGNGVDIVYNCKNDQKNVQELLKKFSGIKSVKALAYATSASSSIVSDDNLLSREFIEHEKKSESSSPQKPSAPAGKHIINFEFRFIDDEAFRRLLKENGISDETPFFSENPQCLATDTLRDIINETGKPRDDVSTVFSVFKKDSFPTEVNAATYKEKPGYTKSTEVIKEGKKYVVYYEDGYLENLKSEEELDPGRAVLVPYENLVSYTPITIASRAKQGSFPLLTDAPCLIYPQSSLNKLFSKTNIAHEAEKNNATFAFLAQNHKAAANEIKKFLAEKGLPTSDLLNSAEYWENIRMVIKVINVFSYGFITLISLIAVANVFNTISTNILLRRREFGVLRSVGLSQSSFRKMLNYECIIYGIKGLALGVPASVLLSVLIELVISEGLRLNTFIFSYKALIIAVLSVFGVIGVTMLYAAGKIKKDNPIDAIRSETF